MFHQLPRLAASSIIVLAAITASGLPAQDKPDDAQTLQGLWAGYWGGGEADGVVYQPVLAEMVIEQGRAELQGFRNIDHLRGTIEIDPQARRIRVTSLPAEGQPRQTVAYGYRLEGDQLTLFDGEQVAIQLQRLPTETNPLASVQLNLVQAAEINEAGELLVTEFNVLRSGLTDREYHERRSRALPTTGASVLVVQAAGLEAVSIAEARKLLDEPRAVAIAFLNDEQLANYQQFHQLWKNEGPPQPDSASVRPTLLQVLRPGTLVIILPAADKVPRP